MGKKRKLIDIDEDVLKQLSLKAVHEGVSVKRYIEDRLEKLVETPIDVEKDPGTSSEQPDTGLDFSRLRTDRT